MRRIDELHLNYHLQALLQRKSRILGGAANG